jgi:putative addiction module antidote
MMIRKVFKAGNSLVVSLPKEAIQLLALQEGSDISVTISEAREQIIIEAVYPELAGVSKGFAQQVTEFVTQYRPALEELAE